MDCDRMTEWIGEDWNAGDLDAAGELAKIYVEFGNDSDQWRSQVRLLLAEYEIPKILQALVTLMATLPNQMEWGNEALHAEIERQVEMYSKAYPAKDRMPERVMASIDKAKIR